MKVLRLIVAVLLLTVAPAIIIGCKTHETSTEKMTTSVNPVTGTETVQKETTVNTKKP